MRTLIRCHAAITIPTLLVLFYLPTDRDRELSSSENRAVVFATSTVKQLYLE